MTNKKQPEALRLAEMLTADEWPGHVTLVSYARECVAELRRQNARITEMEAQLEAIGAGEVSGPLMGEQSAPKVSDAQRALHELILNRLSHAELLEKAHYLMELNSNQGRTIGELQDLVALSAQAPNQPGGFSAGDMASAAAQGYRDGWTAAQADSQQAVAGDERDDFEKVFPLPSGCIRVGTGYASTGYSNWAAHTHCERWQGWQARAARSPADSVLEDAARLDWLAKSDWYVGPGDFYCGEGGGLYDFDDKNTGAAELRAAIDAARAAQKEGSTT